MKNKNEPDSLSTRDYFAAKAMQGLIISELDTHTSKIARAAYKYADVMMAERDKDDKDKDE